MHWHRFVPWRALPALGAGQEYRLLMQPVLMSPISTGSSNKWFLWPGSLACFLVVEEGREEGPGPGARPAPVIGAEPCSAAPMGRERMGKERVPGVKKKEKKSDAWVSHK